MTNPTKPVIELKNIKVAAFASEETHCYEATLYVDGVKWGTVANDGHGGADNFHGVGGKSYSDLKALDERIAATYPKIDTSDLYGDGEAHEMDESLETICGQLVNEHVAAKALKRDFARKVLFLKPGQPGIYEIPLRQKGRVLTVEQVEMAARTRTPDLKVLNTMPFAEALAVYRAAAAGAY